MPISLSALKSGERTLLFEYDGESAEVTYRVSSYTPELEQAVAEKLESGLPASSTAVILAELLIDWDVVDENGERLPTDYATVSRFPMDFLTALLTTISEDQRAAREDRKNSGGGSAQRANSGNARRGTR